MAEIIFTNPKYLWIMAIVPFLIIIHIFTLRRSKTAAIKFANFEAIERVSKGDILGKPHRGFLRNKNIGLLILRTIVYSLLILSVAGATIKYQGRASEFDYVLAIDASSSMLADDYIPSRFDAAKSAASKFIDAVPSGANIAIVGFASTAIIELKPTSNFQEAKSAISKLKLYESGGTAIGDAIITSTNLFNPNKLRTIILLTDGQNNIGIDIDTAVEYAKQNGVVINSIGVATKEGGNISGISMVSKLDEGNLKKISERTSGKFFLANDASSLANAFKEIASSSERTLTFDISWVLLVAAIALLGIEWVLINTVYRTIP